MVNLALAGGHCLPKIAAKFEISADSMRRWVSKGTRVRYVYDQPANAALATNLLDPPYVKTLCGTIDEVPQAFAEVVQSGAAPSHPALDRRSYNYNLGPCIRQWKLEPTNGPTASRSDVRLPS